MRKNRAIIITERRKEDKDMKGIYFDMDGTIANFYGIKNWLDYLQKKQTKPYREARPLVDMRKLGKEIHRLQNLGYTVGIISWLSKNGNQEYNERVTEAKKKWLTRHLGSVHFDEIHIVEYGTPKYMFGDGILFDDEERNRKEWSCRNSENLAFDVNNILDILEAVR